MAASAVAGVLLGAAVGAPLIAATHTTRAATGSSANYVVSPAGARLLYRAEQILITNCMHRHGFRYWAVPLVTAKSGVKMMSPDKDSSYFSNLRRGLKARFLANLNGPEGSRSVAVRMPAGYVIGHSVYGCQAAAEARLYGNYGRWFAAVHIADDLQSLPRSQVMSIAVKYREEVKLYRQLRYDAVPVAREIARSVR